MKIGAAINTSQASTWSGSELKIVQAMCLNEIVNAPQEFCSSSPHLVVQHIDWIQCRYLFVRVGNSPFDNYVTPTTQPTSEERYSVFATPPFIFFTSSVT